VLAGEQGHLLADTPLTLAETASVFGEMLTFRRCSTPRPTRKRRKAMLAGKVEDMLNTVVRQIAFVEFERQVHDERRDGELSPTGIGEIWLEVQRESLGPALRFDEDYRTTGLHPALHPLAVLRLRLRLRRLPGELALRRYQPPPAASPRSISTCCAPAAKRHKELLAPFGLDAATRRSGTAASASSRLHRRAGSAWLILKRIP
jgi:oligoendopeptidase F